MDPVEQMGDEELVREFLGYTERLSQMAAAELVGVSQSTVSEWRRGVYREMQRDKRTLLEMRVAEGRKNGPFRRKPPMGRTPAAPVAESPPGGLASQAEEILHSDASEVEKAAQLLGLWGLQRAAAIATLAETLRRDQEAIERQSEVLLNLSRAALEKATPQPMPTNGESIYSLVEEVRAALGRLEREGSQSGTEGTGESTRSREQS